MSDVDFEQLDFRATGISSDLDFERLVFSSDWDHVMIVRVPLLYSKQVHSSNDGSLL